MDLFSRYRYTVLLWRVLAPWLLIAPGGLRAQSLEQWERWGDAAMERGEYYGATRFYAGALEMGGGRLQLQWKQAEAARLSHQYALAAELYARVHYKDQGRTYRDALRWQAEMQMCTGAYDAAETSWRTLLRRNRDPLVRQRAENAIAGCALAKALAHEPPTQEAEHLPMPVNTSDSEFGPRFGPDSALYFSSLRGELNEHGEVIDTAAYRIQLLRTRLNGTTWSAPEPLSDAVNGTGHNANSAWTHDGQHLLFTRCVAGAPCRIHIAPVLAEGFGAAIPLPGLGDAHSTQPMVVMWDGVEKLLFVSDRPGGSGGLDIWWANLENGQAADVHPLPGTVNSPGNETGPWLDGRSGTLWFSSDHHPGLGGYDIFRSRFANDVFGTPEHAGVPLNSPANDLYPTIPPGQRVIWWTSNRVGSFAAKGETCCNDLYRLPLETAPPDDLVQTDVPDTVATAEVGAVNSARIITRFDRLRVELPLVLFFDNDQPDPRSWATTTPHSYSATYQQYRDRLPEYVHAGGTAAIQDFFTTEVDRGMQRLDTLIDALHEALSAGLSVTLTVRGHASPLARSDYNANLSMRRIESLRNELRTARNGALRPYLDGQAAGMARLELRALPFGEDQSAAGVSDDLADLRRSVYAVEAARERRIQIEAVDLRAVQRMPVEQQRMDLGRLRQDVERHVVFTIRNQGDTPMRLLDSQADCGCTHAELPQAPIAPGGTVEVAVSFNGRAPLGPLERTVVVRTNGTPERVELTIVGEMVP